MNYLILARKWRPKLFSEVIGQKQIIQTLTNSLNFKKIHQSWLFFGKKGVGKTSVARILAKSLNCKNGITINPCQICSTCKEIKSNTSPDLIEVDGASNTQVESIKTLLEGIVYKPIKGKYKIYLIDEVHMLSKHSFNALLKILEEPPKHVKFILITTEINKIPETIQSRCLLLKFKKIQTFHIYQNLKLILKKEKIKFQKNAIKKIAKFSNSSMRDALNLLDQAIVFTKNKITTDAIFKMLGVTDEKLILKLIKYIISYKGNKILQLIHHISRQESEWKNVLSLILEILHKIILLQSFPKTHSTPFLFMEKYHKKILKIAKSVKKRKIFLFYKTVLIGKKELKFSPSKRIGVEIALLQSMYIFKKNNN